MKKFKLLLSLLKITVFCVILYVGYAAFVDIKSFLKNPLDALVNAFPFSTETKIDVDILADELLKKSEFIFAENIMALEYKFEHKTGFLGLASVSATYQWDASTKFGITRDCFSAKQNGKDLEIKVSKIIMFNPTHNNENRISYDESKAWTDQGTTERAFRQDKPFATRDVFDARFTNDKRQEIIEFSKESLSSFVKAFIGDENINIVVKVNNKFVHEQELEGSPSEYYKDQEKSVLGYWINRTN